MAKQTQSFNPRQVMSKDSYEIFHYLDMASRHMEAHLHEFYEVYFFIDGEMDYWIEGSVYPMKPGDILLIDPMVLHKPVPKTEADRYERIVLWINRQYLAGLENGRLERCFGGQQRLLRLSVTESRQLLVIAQKLVQESYGTEEFSESCAFGLLVQLLGLLNRMRPKATAAQQEGWSTPTLISQILEYIGKHYQQPLTLEQLASHFFINKYYLSHEFRKVVGTGVHRYITLKRLHCAYDLLEEGKAPGEVSAACGFSDYTAFFKAFKGEYGISPSMVCASAGEDR